MANIYNSQLDAFSLYHQIQEHEQSPSTTIGPALPALGHALAGSTGTAISNLCIYPLDLIITRLQVQRSLRKESTVKDPTEYDGVIDAFRKIYTQEGISGFYTGVLQDTGKSIVDSFLFFLFYNYMRETRINGNGNGRKLPVADELAVGTLAGACSKFFTTPISNIVTRKQTASLLAARFPNTNKSVSVSEIYKQIREEKGIQGFWSGYSASLVLTLNPSLTFFLYEFFKRTMIPRSQRDDPGARTTFLIAAISKAIASTVTYPFALAKTRAQASSSSPLPTSTAQELKDEAQGAETKSDAKRVGKHAGRVAKRTTVFAAILKIYREEGIAALYEGVGGEICKGFFSHGITMLVKEAVHKVIIQLYFFLLKLTNKVPSAGELTNQAGEAAQNVGSKVGEVAGDVSGRAGEAVSGASDRIKEGYVVVSRNITATVSDLGDKTGVITNNASESAKSANERASQEAGHLLGNAQEMLGGKISEAKDEE